MKKIFFILTIAVAMSVASCSESDFSDNYADPSKVSTSTVEKQFAGFLVSNKDYVLPSYWNYFVVYRTTLTRYTQAVGWSNVSPQYVPGSGVEDRWKVYYNFLTQYRELEKVYAGLSETDKKDKRIYMIAATIYLYDHTQKNIDLHGDIPFLGAGKLSTNGGDYAASFAKYDTAESLYTKMLDELKAFSDELNTLVINTGVQTGFKTQDVVNKGNVVLWKKYCNSLRLRMLTRVSGVASFQARSNSEIAAILGNQASYPVVAANVDNIQINVFTVTDASPAAISLNSKGFQTGLEDWNGNIAGKLMIDHMNTNSDPRRKAMFEPGVNAAGVYKGLDPMGLQSAQDALIAGGTMSIYNRSTLSRNQFFPGVLINAAEVSFWMAEYYLKAGNDASAKAAYENGIKLSSEYYDKLRALSNDNTAGVYTPPTAAEVTAYIAGTNIAWANAATNTDKLKLIANQKWIHSSVIEPIESWSEIRRLNYPQLSFVVDNNAQTQPPVRWNYPPSELIYNTENYNAVKSKDNLNTKLFWDL